MDENVLSTYEVVVDRYGKKHKVYSVRFKDVKTVTKFTENYSPDLFTTYLLAPVLDDDGKPETDKDGHIVYDNGFYDDLMEVIELALDGRETKEQIDEWLDMATAQVIVDKFLGLSQFKKKLNQIATLNGGTSLPALSATLA
jgi:hypothetical protein